jgi:hypothetical protein
MLLVNDPGPWQYFVKRHDNAGLSVDAVRRKYLAEAMSFHEQMQIAMMQAQNAANPSAGGASQPQGVIGGLASNCIEFVNNTTDGTSSELTITTSGPTNFTLDWGDGTILSDLVDGEYIADHTYADSDQSYNCTLCFEDASLVTELDFEGDD